MGGWICVDGWVDGRVDGYVWVDGLADGWVDICVDG
jgi:hypothetical protein